MAEVFHPDVYRTDVTPAVGGRPRRPCGRPAALGEETADVAIIGGGYAGLSAALHLARDHGIRAVVLDAGEIGWGASGRNGGFVTYPAVKLSAAASSSATGWTRTGPSIRCRPQPWTSSATCSTRRASMRHGRATPISKSPTFRRVDELRAAAEFWRDTLGLPARFLSREAFAEIGHGGTEQFGAFQLDGPSACTRCATSRA